MEIKLIFHTLNMLNCLDIYSVKALSIIIVHILDANPLANGEHVGIARAA